MPNVNFDEIVKRSVRDSFGHILDFYATETSLTDVEGIVLLDQAQEVNDQSGRRYFMWGVSTWGGEDIVKE